MEHIMSQRHGRRFAIAGLIVLLPLALVGCGTAVGAGAGGYAGNRLTHGSAVGTVGGAVAGGVLGHVLTGE